MGRQEIPIESEEALLKFLDRANKGDRLVLTKHGVINPSSVDSIVPDRARMGEVQGLLQYQEERGGKMLPKYTRETAERAVLGEGALARLIDGKKKLGAKMTMLGDGERTAAQEEAAAEERRIK